MARLFKYPNGTVKEIEGPFGFWRFDTRRV